MRFAYIVAIAFLLLAVLTLALYLLLPSIMRILLPDQDPAFIDYVCQDPDPFQQQCEESGSNCLAIGLRSICSTLRDLLKKLAALFLILSAVSAIYGALSEKKLKSGSARP